MSIYNQKEYTKFALCSIKENLDIAKFCINTEKEEVPNSCYGMPAFTLLTSVIDTIGSFYPNETDFEDISINNVINNKPGDVKKHFYAFYEKFIKNNNNVINVNGVVDKKDYFYYKFYKEGRCKATHNNALGLNFIITIENRGNGACIWEEKDNNNDITYVQLSRLYDLVYNAYNEMTTDAGIPTPQEVSQATTGITSQQVTTYLK